jgi:hypothetical protein
MWMADLQSVPATISGLHLESRQAVRIQPNRSPRLRRARPVQPGVPPRLHWMQ